MAILTKTGYNKILRKILETENIGDELEADIDRLKSDFEEREGFLKGYGEVNESEEIDEYDYVGKTFKEDNGEWEKKYKDVKQKYLDRFFGDSETPDKPNVIEETTETETKSIDDLLFERKGE